MIIVCDYKNLLFPQYEQDVALYKQAAAEPASQVSSSTDSGYGNHPADRYSGELQLSLSININLLLVA